MVCHYQYKYVGKSGSARAAHTLRSLRSFDTQWIVMPQRKTRNPGRGGTSNAGKLAGNLKFHAKCASIKRDGLAPSLKLYVFLPTSPLLIPIP